MGSFHTDNDFDETYTEFRSILVNQPPSLKKKKTNKRTIKKAKHEDISAEKIIARYIFFLI